MAWVSSLKFFKVLSNNYIECSPPLALGLENLEIMRPSKPNVAIMGVLGEPAGSWIQMFPPHWSGAHAQPSPTHPREKLQTSPRHSFNLTAFLGHCHRCRSPWEVLLVVFVTPCPGTGDGESPKGLPCSPRPGGGSWELLQAARAADSFLLHLYFHQGGPGSPH